MAFFLIIFDDVGLQIKIESLGGQQTESLDPVAFFRFANGSLLFMDLHYYEMERSSKVIGFE